MSDETSGMGRASGRGWITTRAANTLRYSLMNLFILAGTAGIAYGGLFSWTGLLLSFVMIGFVDELFGDAGNKEDMPPVWYMQAMLYLTLPLLIFATLIAFNTTTAQGLPWLDALMRALGFDPVAARSRPSGPLMFSNGSFVSLGVFYGAAGVNVAHELVHRTGQKVDYIIGRWLLAFTWDTGFAIEHVYGHHRNVGTEADPATARRGELIYAFVLRSTIGQWQAARKFEAERLRRKGIANTPWNNRFWRGQLMTLVVILFYCAFLGPVGILFSAYSGAIGKIYLEIVNFIEHYGLVRIPGTPVEPRHAWDSYRRVSTGMFYNLQLHAHHHTVATRRYWELEQQPGKSPMLPMGYMAMIFLSFAPYWWTPFSNRLLAKWDRELASPAEVEYLKAKGIYLGDRY
ncbi:MAG TPA: alkane 1-monooxygenase [Devosiaceae bacterium]|nr:alkane 1-monooxygenase [Devosiaceae bacterium]